MAQQTAVEWLLQRLILNGTIRLTYTEHPIYKELSEQAKEIEKQQIIDAHLTGLIYPLEIEATKQAEEFYTETYGK
jgi:hypothetical protein